MSSELRPRTLIPAIIRTRPEKPYNGPIARLNSLAKGTIIPGLKSFVFEIIDILKYMAIGMANAVRHPRGTRNRRYCNPCKARFLSDEPVCPRCHTPVENELSTRHNIYRFSRRQN